MKNITDNFFLIFKKATTSGKDRELNEILHLKIHPEIPDGGGTLKQRQGILRPQRNLSSDGCRIVAYSFYIFLS